ncbi:MAG: 50S ribosome-binding GTPase, partial [Spirochaetaceae bacterium]|nr:50S ribosome-binding GTPase [Spirochaetaceae bacterium]
MSLNATPSAERVHIGFFGMRNAGKSSLVNAVTGQNLSLVSPTKGTTTDPVKKAMEILPLGPVVIIDTPGLDDEGDLGKMRVERAKEVLDQVQIAVLVVDATKGLSREDALLEAELEKRKIPHIVAHNKWDLAENPKPLSENEIYVSAVTGHGITQLKEKLAGFASKIGNSRPLIKDLIAEKDTVVLVTPIDESAPKGRIILPQQMVLREILDSKAIAVVAQPSEI